MRHRGTLGAVTQKKMKKVFDISRMSPWLALSRFPRPCAAQPNYWAKKNNWNFQPCKHPGHDHWPHYWFHKQPTWFLMCHVLILDGKMNLFMLIDFLVSQYFFILGTGFWSLYCMLGSGTPLGHQVGWLRVCSGILWFPRDGASSRPWEANLPAARENDLTQLVNQGGQAFFRRTSSGYWAFCPITFRATGCQWPSELGCRGM
jgi:hypothetical protein